MVLNYDQDLSLPDEGEFFEAISDCSNIVICAGGGELSAYSQVLKEQSTVFGLKLSKFLAGESGTGFSEQAGKVTLDLDCGYDTAQALFRYILSNGREVPCNSASPAMLRELASVAHEWKAQSLLQVVDSSLTSQMQADSQKFRSTDPKEWQYAGSHIRERGVKMLKLALEVGLQNLQQEAEVFVAANWHLLSTDDRLTKDLDVSSLCRIHWMAEDMQKRTDSELSFNFGPGEWCGRRQSFPRRNSCRRPKSKVA